MLALQVLPRGERPLVAQAVPVAVEDIAFVNRLRVVSLRCRVAARLDLFRACSLLQATPDRSGTAYAEAVVRTLGEGLAKPARFHRPGTAELTFDERWLISILRAIRRGDHDSVVFLIQSRILPAARRQLRMILNGLAQEAVTAPLPLRRTLP